MKVLIIFFLIIGWNLSFSQRYLHSTIVNQNKKFGLVEDGTGKAVLSIEYDTVISHTPFKGVFTFKKNQKYGYAKLLYDWNARTYSWDISDCIYDTIYYLNLVDDFIVLKEKGSYKYQHLDVQTILQDNWSYDYTKAIIREVYSSSNNYDTLYPSESNLILKKNDKYGIHIGFDHELDCEWDSITQFNRHYFVWKGGYFAHLTVYWDNRTEELAKTYNYKLITPYCFLHPKEIGFYDKHIIAIQQGRPLRVFGNFGTREVTIHNKKNKDGLIVDTTFKYFLSFNDLEKSYKISLVLKQNSPEMLEARSKMQINTVQNEVFANNSFRYGINQYYFTNENGEIMKSFNTPRHLYYLTRLEDILLIYDCSSEDPDLVRVSITNFKNGKILKKYSQKNRIYEIADHSQNSRARFYAVFSTKFDGKKVDFEPNTNGSIYIINNGKSKKKIVGYIKNNFSKKEPQFVRFKWFSSFS